MKNFIYAAAVLAFACAPANRDATATQSEITATAATGSAPAAATTSSSMSDMKVPTPASAPKAMEENRPMSYYENKVAELHTTAGEIDIRFFPDVAPNHVKNFIDLAEKGFYNGTKFHRIIPEFMVQGGDPNTISGNPATWGTGGSSKNINAEFSSVSHKRGIVSMARSQDPNSASSQFFIVVKDSPFLDRQYTAFGQLIRGDEVLRAIGDTPVTSSNSGEQSKPTSRVGVENIKIIAADSV